MPETVLSHPDEILTVLMSQPQKKTYLLLSLPNIREQTLVKTVANSVIKLNLDTVRSSDFL